MAQPTTLWRTTRCEYDPLPLHNPLLYEEQQDASTTHYHCTTHYSTSNKMLVRPITTAQPTSLWGTTRCEYDPLPLYNPLLYEEQQDVSTTHYHCTTHYSMSNNMWDDPLPLHNTLLYEEQDVGTTYYDTTPTLRHCGRVVSILSWASSWDNICWLDAWTSVTMLCK